MIELVPLQYYVRFFYWTMYALCLITCFYYLGSPGCKKLMTQRSFLLPLFFSIILILYIGLRPTSYRFGDMPLYQHRWNMLDSFSDVNYSFKSEWFFDSVMILCKKIVPNVQFWFVVVDIIYIGCQLWACKKLLWENVWMTIMFVFFSFQFFTFGTNGIRNGMGCAFIMLSIAYFCDRCRTGNIIGLFLFFLAMGCHRSVIVPMAALMVSLYIIKDIKISGYIWIGCIALSIFAGGFFQNIIANIGFDDRFSSYSSLDEETMAQFSRTGFRWDFLLYSAMPIWLSWYVRSIGVFDRTFTLLANTYVIANSFWVLVCRMPYSNRFAYLSWFMYALVIAFAVVRVPIWNNQDRTAGWILLAHSSFTIFMHFFLY